MQIESTNRARAPVVFFLSAQILVSCRPVVCSFHSPLLDTLPLVVFFLRYREISRRYLIGLDRESGVHRRCSCRRSEVKEPEVSLDITKAVVRALVCPVASRVARLGFRVTTLRRSIRFR